MAGRSLANTINRFVYTFSRQGFKFGSQRVYIAYDIAARNHRLGITMVRLYGKITEGTEDRHKTTYKQKLKSNT